MLTLLRKKLNQWQTFKLNLKEKNRFYYFVVDGVEVILTALIFALIIRQYALQTSLVYSGSMEPTMMVGDRLFVNKVIFHIRPPQRGEIVLFESPYKDKKEFVKRLIGLPGETIEIKKGLVYVNDELLVLSGINVQRDDGFFGPVKVPSNSYLVLGDNRANSADSRVWGYVPKAELVGKAVFVFWPLSRMQMLY